MTLDLNGKALTNKGAGGGTSAVGILVRNANAAQVTGGRISGFHTEVYLNSSRGHTVQELDISSNLAAGILLSSSYLIIRNNHLRNLSSSALANVEGCSVPTGIGVKDAYQCLVIGNTIDMGDSSGSQGSVAVALTSSADDIVLINNSISNSDLGIVFETTSRGERRDNICSNTLIPFVGGLDLGGNIVLRFAIK